MKFKVNKKLKKLFEHSYNTKESILFAASNFKTYHSALDKL